MVEGYHDLSKIKSIFPNIDVVITNGSEISETTLIELKKLNATRGLILLLDPDYQGERIRKIINEYVGNTKHIYLKKEDTISKNKKKVGIEHAKTSDIMNAFKDIKTMHPSPGMITMNDIFELGLSGKPHSKALRKKVCDTIGIGLSNTKTLKEKLNMFQISKEEVISILRK